VRGVQVPDFTYPTVERKWLKDKMTSVLRDFPATIHYAREYVIEREALTPSLGRVHSSIVLRAHHNIRLFTDAEQRTEFVEKRRKLSDEPRTRVPSDGADAHLQSY
jgi:hypothetical protein